MLIKYFANDGKDFGSEKECLKHEEKLRQKKISEEQKLKEKQARWEEVERAKEKYNNLYKAYEKDYGAIYTIEDWYNDMVNFVVGGNKR